MAIFLEILIWISYSLPKWRFSCSLSGHTDCPQFYWLLNLEWPSYFEHAIQYLLNTCLYCIRSWSHTKPHTRYLVPCRHELHQMQRVTQRLRIHDLWWLLYISEESSLIINKSNSNWTCRKTHNVIEILVGIYIYRCNLNLKRFGQCSSHWKCVSGLQWKAALSTVFTMAS